MSQSKRWTFTLNNPSEHGETRQFIEEHLRVGKSYKYLVFQLEQGENGTPHWQGNILIQYEFLKYLSKLFTF
jgi:hypothetical protein